MEIVGVGCGSKDEGGEELTSCGELTEIRGSGLPQVENRWFWSSLPVCGESEASADIWATHKTVALD